MREDSCPEVFKMVKVNKSRKTRVMELSEMEISNIFEHLDDQECVFEETSFKYLSGDISRHGIRKRHRKCQEVLDEFWHLVEFEFTNVMKVDVNHTQCVELIKPKKRKVFSQTTFESDNKFQILQDNSEENILKLIKRLNILQMKMKDFKKCRKCNFKQRKCILSPLSCKAAQKICHACQKPGHFP